LAGQAGDAERSRDREGAVGGLASAGGATSGGAIPGLQGAGGIGGLLAADDANGTPGVTGDDEQYVFFYDAQGNVGQLVKDAVQPLARYEYAAYGRTIGPDADGDGDWRDDAGPFATTNPYRFSTKPCDDALTYTAPADAGLYYYGYRYYSPRLGRWVSRDPIEEDGGTNLYAYVENKPSIEVDPSGKMLANKGNSKEACQKAVAEALKDPKIKELYDHAKGGKDPLLGIACLGKVRCITCLWPGIGGGCDPFSRDIFVCSNRMPKEKIKQTVHHELAHAVGMCGTSALFGCKSCMKEEKRAYYLSGGCGTDEVCTERAWCSCKARLSCFEYIDTSKNYRKVGWPPEPLPDRGYRPPPVAVPEG